MKTIPLTKGFKTTVDDEDFEWLNKLKWCATEDSHNVYAMTNIKKNNKFQKLKMHTYILGTKEGFGIDHKDGNGLNNCRDNLRFATPTENQQNSRKKSNATSKYKGVCWLRKLGKWQANICVEKKQIHLGLFESEIEAALIYNNYALQYFNEFACINNIDRRRL